jgi:hypothetical protein
MDLRHYVGKENGDDFNSSVRAWGIALVQKRYLHCGDPGATHIDTFIQSCETWE